MMARRVEGIHDVLNDHMFDVERNGLRQVALCLSQHEMTTINQIIPDRSPPGSTRTAPSAVHQDGGIKYATGAPTTIYGRDNSTLAHGRQGHGELQGNSRN